MPRYFLFSPSSLLLGFYRQDGKSNLGPPGESRAKEDVEKGSCTEEEEGKEWGGEGKKTGCEEWTSWLTTTRRPARGDFRPEFEKFFALAKSKWQTLASSMCDANPHTSFDSMLLLCASALDPSC